MTHGSVIVDMAAEQGGNCALTERDKVVHKFGVTIIGLTDLPSRMARQSSELYAATVFNLLKEGCPDETCLALNLEDEIHRGVLVLKDGELMWPPPKPPPARAAAPAPAPAAAARPGNHAAQPASSGLGMRVALAGLIILFGAAGILGPPEFVQHL